MRPILWKASSPAELAKVGVLSGLAVAVAAWFFVEPVGAVFIAAGVGIGAALSTKNASSGTELLDGTPKAIPDMPLSLANLRDGIAQFIAVSEESDADALERVERFAFHVIGRLMDSNDLLSVLGGTDCELGQAAIALATNALDAANRGNSGPLRQASHDVDTFRSNLAQLKS